MQRTQEAPWGLHPRSISAAFMLAATLAAAPGAFANKEEHARDLGPGCARERPAIGHYAGAVIVRNPGKQHKPPIPCSTRTGWRTGEVSIAITNEGTVLYQPAFSEAGSPIGLIRSVDRGETWGFVGHAPAGTPVTLSIDQNLWVDRQTGRGFWISIDLPSPTPARLDRSDDDGRTWFSSDQPCPNRAFGPLGCGHPQVFTGPPTESMEHLLQGYPNVVYVLGGGANPLALQKSLDGGKTWGAAVTIPTPAGVSCAVFTNFGLNGVVGRDGTVYVPFTPCQRPYIAISHDEGDTWQNVLVADRDTLGPGLLAAAMDKHGNLYAAWVGAADRLPYLAISRDNGLHWDTPLMIGAPGLGETALPGLVAGAKGQVAVTYYGSKNPPAPLPPPCTGFSLSCPGYESQTWDTFVTETFDALDQRPLFWSATLNDPDKPTWYGCSPSSIGVFLAPGSTSGCTSTSKVGGPLLGGRLDYYGAAMAPDGTPWVGFVQECPDGRPVAGNPNCPSTLTGASTDSMFGLVGRLVRAPGESEDDDE
jgi:hypothetical protein